jgi:FMN-dependent NADH-azoreductase
MSTLLHISASPRGQRSDSLAIADTSSTSSAQPTPTSPSSTGISGTAPCPGFGPSAAAAKMAIFGGADPECDEANAWRATTGRVRPLRLC